MATSKKFTPGSDATPEEIFTYPFFIDEESKGFIENHKRIMFIIRGPPGTGKFSLTELMKRHFPESAKCSADDYFSKTFNPPKRTKDSLSQSHEYCQKRVRHECTKNSHPVIVSNTHMRKSEMQVYLDLAAEFEYTVIITSTLDKFEATPAILAKTNTKGLSEEYFQNRLKAWQDVFPIFMGWFLCPDDSFYLLHQLQGALDALLDDGRFCTVFDAFDKDALLNNYKAKTLLSCMAGFVSNSPFELQKYSKSAEVLNAYGKCFTISIQAFVVTKSHIFAIVQLDDSLRSLTFKPNFVNKSIKVEEEGDLDSIIDRICSMSLKSSYNFKLTPLLSEFTQCPKTAELNEGFDDRLNVNKCSFIHLAQSGEKVYSMNELNQHFRKKFVGADEELSADRFKALEDGYAAYRLSNDGWVIRTPKILSVKTIFTGLYI